MLKYLKIPAIVAIFAVIPVAFSQSANLDSRLGIALSVNDACASVGSCCPQPGSICLEAGSVRIHHMYKKNGCDE